MNDVAHETPDAEAWMQNREALNGRAMSLIQSVVTTVRANEQARTQVADAFTAGSGTPTHFTIKGDAGTYKIGMDSSTPLRLTLEKLDPEGESLVYVSLDVDPDLNNISGSTEPVKQSWLLTQKAKTGLQKMPGIVSFRDATHYDKTPGMSAEFAQDRAQRLTMTPQKQGELAAELQKGHHLPIADTSDAVAGAERLVAEFVGFAAAAKAS